MPTPSPPRPPARRSTVDAGASTMARQAAHPSEVRAALDAFRHIVQALRVGRARVEQTGLSSAQLFALQQIAEHPHASINDVAALTFTHQSSVSVVIQRLVRQRLVVKGCLTRGPASSAAGRHGQGSPPTAPSAQSCAGASDCGDCFATRGGPPPSRAISQHNRQADGSVQHGCTSSDVL
jgi:hypothetical protein